MKLNKLTLICALLGSVLLTGTACKKGFEDMNTPYNKPTEAALGELYNYVVSSLQLGYQEMATYHSFLYEINEQTTQYASSGYRMENASNELWGKYYHMLSNSKLIDTLIAQDPNASKMTNMLAMNRVIRAYSTIRMTENFGNMPYSEAGMGQYLAGHYKPAYDAQESVYKTSIGLLDWAVDNLSTSADQINYPSETLLKNNIAKWVKLANSLRLRAAVTMYDKDATFAAAQITKALSKPLLADGEDMGLWPADIPGIDNAMHPWSFSANQYIRLGTTMWNQMSDNNNKDGSGIYDPRMKIFYEPNNAGEWVAYPQNPTASTPSEGGDPYNQNRRTNWANKGASNIYSNVNFYFEDQAYIPELFITAAQVHLYKAEIYNRGLGVAANAATAKTEYEAGVKASAKYWTSIAMNTPTWVEGKPSAQLTDAQLATLLAHAKVAYPATASAALKYIYIQLWIDGFRQPWDIWTLKRRTGGNLPKDPNNPSYTENNYGIYHRYTYPTSEQNYNLESWKTATGGTDSYSTKIWLEK